MTKRTRETKRERDRERLHEECAAIIDSESGETDEARQCAATVFEGQDKERCERPSGHIGCHAKMHGGLMWGDPKKRLLPLYPRAPKKFDAIGELFKLLRDAGAVVTLDGSPIDEANLREVLAETAVERLAAARQLVERIERDGE